MRSGGGRLGRSWPENGPKCHRRRRSNNSDLLQLPVHHDYDHNHQHPVLRNLQTNLEIIHTTITGLLYQTLVRLCLKQLDRWRHSLSDVAEYVTTEKVTRIYFQHTSYIHTPVGNSNTLGLYSLIISYFEAFFLKERMNISDSLHKLRISHGMSFSHYEQNTSVSQI
jgi:hypothetical protein